MFPSGILLCLNANGILKSPMQETHFINIKFVFSDPLIYRQCSSSSSSSKKRIRPGVKAAIFHDETKNLSPMLLMIADILKSLLSRFWLLHFLHRPAMYFLILSAPDACTQDLIDIYS